MRSIPAQTRARIRPYWHEYGLRHLGLYGLIARTNTFTTVTWLGRPIWQNPLDAWLLQETIVEQGIDLVIECGTNRGGSANYVASLFDLMGRGRVITIDMQSMVDFTHPRIEFIIGSSVDVDVVAGVRRRLEELAPANPMVLLDSDHAGVHVERELALYAPLVHPDGLIHVQDGCIDEFRAMRDERPGPLWATRRFLESDDRFEIDEERSARYLFTHNPSGWLRRVR